MIFSFENSISFSLLFFFLQWKKQKKNKDRHYLAEKERIYRLYGFCRFDHFSNGYCNCVSLRVSPFHKLFHFYFLNQFLNYAITVVLKNCNMMMSTTQRFNQGEIYIMLSSLLFFFLPYKQILKYCFLVFCEFFLIHRYTSSIQKWHRYLYPAASGIIGAQVRINVSIIPFFLPSPSFFYIISLIISLIFVILH